MAPLPSLRYQANIFVPLALSALAGFVFVGVVVTGWNLALGAGRWTAFAETVGLFAPFGILAFASWRGYLQDRSDDRYLRAHPSIRTGALWAPRSSSSLAWARLLAVAAMALTLAAVTSAFQFVQDWRIQHGVRTGARIEIVNDQGAGQVLLTVRFSTRDGRRARATVEAGGHGYDYANGDEIEIVYRAAHPSDAELPQHRSLPWTAALLLAITSLLGAGAWLLWHGHRKHAKRHAPESSHAGER
jgi:hypothetical protein